MGQKVISIVVAVMIAVAVLVELQGTLATATGVGGVFENTATGSLLTLIPLVIVAGLLGYAYISKK